MGAGDATPTREPGARSVRLDLAGERSREGESWHRWGAGGTSEDNYAGMLYMALTSTDLEDQIVRGCQLPWGM